MPPVANFLDTNILVYSISDDARASTAQSLMAEPFVLSVQSLNEFANVTRKKMRLPWSRIQAAIDDFAQMASIVVALDQQATMTALDLAGRYNLSFYDALMVAAALKADCLRFYSEDLHDGLLVGEKLEIINPFR